MIYRYNKVTHTAEQINRFALIWQEEVINKRRTRKRENVDIVMIEATAGTFNLLDSMIEQLHRLQAEKENQES